MNRTYKVIWSKARRCYVVVSELAKSQHKSSSKSEHISSNVHRGYLGKAAAAAVVASLLTFGGMAYSPVMADTAANKAGEGAGVAIGEGSKAPKAENVAIGKGAEIKYSNGASSATGDVIVGSGAVIDNYASQGGSIAIGKNATIENMTGKQESLFSLGQTKYHSGNFLGTLQIPDNPENVAGSIALGDNTYARTGSIMIGSHNYRGLIGDQTVDTSKTKDTSTTKGYVKTKDYGININATTLGTNSFNQGAFSSVTGAYSIISGKYNGSGCSNYGAQNFGATITGSLNSIESATSSSIYSGIANSIVGTANRTSNSNGSLIFGAGNEIKNSITDISAPTSGGDSAKALQDSLMKAVQKSKSGGATLVIGGGNKADYTQKTQILGVNNTVTGTEKNISNYNMIDGFNNTITGASHLYTIGTDNLISDSRNSIIFGDGYNTTSGPNNISGLINSVIIGNSTNKSSGYVPFQGLTNIVSLGNGNIMSKTDGAIAIGNDNFMRRDGAPSYGYDTGNVAIGNNTYINSYVNQGDSIVIGKNATVLNRTGTLEHAFAFGKNEGKDYSGSIAIGQNSYARSGSTMIGVHSYQGPIGDITVDFEKGKSEGTSGIGKYQESMDVTTIGNDSYNNGVFSTVVGSYTAVSGSYHSQKWAENVYGMQNFGAAVLGSLNSVESVTSEDDAAISAGMADSILGSANRTKNANGTIMVGAGNVVEDSSKTFDVSEIQPQKGKDGQPTPNALSAAMRESIKNANGGGAAAVVGNGNEVKNSTNVSVFGSKNSVTYTTNSQIYGDNRIVTGADGQVIDGAVIVGSADAKNPLTTNNKNVTILGYNANVIQDGGVAIGANSVASTAAFERTDNVGYDPANGNHSKDTTGTWKSTAAAVSVGDTSKHITRQITNVAAGKEDTDAVNVAQLKAVDDKVASGFQVTDGKTSVNIGADKKITFNNGNYTTASVEQDGTAGAKVTYNINTATLIPDTFTGKVTEPTTDGVATAQNVANAINNASIYVVADNTPGNKKAVKAGDTIHFAAKDNNLILVQDGAKFTYGLNKEINISKVTTSDPTKGSTVQTAEGITTKDAAGNTYIQDARGIILTPKTLEKGKTAVSLTNTGLNNGGNVISGVVDGQQDNDAVNVSQLRKAITTTQNNDQHIQSGEYTVGKNLDGTLREDSHSVSMDVVDSQGKKKGAVVIKDVAKASEVGDVSKLNKEVKNTGSTTVVDAINNVNTKVNTVDKKVGDLNYSSTQYVKKGDSVTASIGKLDEAIHNAAAEAGKHSTVSAGSNITVTSATKDGKTDYAVSLKPVITVNSVTTDNLTVNNAATIGKVTINKDNKGTIGNLTNTTWDANKITSGQAATEDQLKEATKNAVNYDGDDSKTITLRKDTTIKNVADTSIEQGSKNAVNAGTIYNETRVAKDGTFIRKANTAGENLTALDHQVASNTESIYHINNRVSNLDNRINKVGAGAAALAALHPLDFDPGDKWDFAVGYGNYRNANSVAFGAFYRPNEDTMFSLGTNFGNGENMFNAGLSFKIGQGSGIATSRTAMAKKIESLEDTVDKQDKKIAELEALVKEQGEMIRQYVGKK